MSKYLLIILFLTLSIAVLQAQEQQVQLKGRVLTADGKPAAGITVRLSSSKATTFTDQNGNFRLKTTAGNYKATFSAVGMVDETIDVEVKAGRDLTLTDITLKESSTALADVIVTGQYVPQSLKNSVYVVKTISAEQIRLRNPTKVQDVLNTQLGFRFSNDLTLGTSDVTLMGVSGQRVKILLDGVPLLDRGDTRESLNQVDINTIDHIEIVEGPMSVSYGSDALGGVINLITKRAIAGGHSFNLSGRIQEETAGQKYRAGDGSGTHMANLGLNWGSNKWQIGGSFSRNDFDGKQLGWKPKEQYLGTATVGYRAGNLNVWYRLDATNETLRADGTPNINTNIETDARYITNRWMHQLQGEWQPSSNLSVNAIASYTDYSRRTQTTTLDLLTGDRRLTLGAGEQDKSVFDTKFFKATAQYKPVSNLTLQPGVEVNLTGSSGARILGAPTINDYAFFVSGEWQPVSFISIRPGARFIKNSVYDAPPVIPSANARINFSSAFNLRLSYARGFRAPALRELYFDFHDASHSIDGNPNLKAEYSNSFNTTLSWQPQITGNAVKFNSSLGGFFNSFSNMITTAFNPADLQKYTYLNIDRAKTAGFTFDNTLTYKALEAKLGFGYTGINSKPADAPADAVVSYQWYPELSSTLLYHFKKLKGDVSLFYKFNGAQPAYETVLVNNVTTINLARQGAYSLADLTLNKQINHRLTLSGGVRNLFNVNNVYRSTLNVSGAHSTGTSVPLAYGRSYFLGLNFQFSSIH